MTQQTTTRQQTITALFDDRSDAMRAIDELVKSGIPRTGINLMPEADTHAASGGTGSSYDTERDEKGFFASLSDLFLPDDDRSTYSEAMHRGSSMVTVAVEPSQAERAEDILEEFGTVDLDERESSWRAEGWQGNASRPASMDVATTREASTPTAIHAADGGEEVIPVVEEQLRVGKRDVSRGRVKVRSYVVETPVSEQVSLRTESVHVERRPVDRALTGDENLFQDRTIEAEATSEEAVISKEARVTGEVLIKKAVEQRTETVSDTLRSTKVEVEDDRAVTDTTVSDGTGVPSATRKI
ncbi:MAG: YsnF/AvaK domain-containing protein [Microvirga sp.]